MSSIELLSTTDLAEILGIDARSIERWRQTGEGPKFVRIGGRLVRYRPQDVEDWLIDQRRSSTAE